MILAPATMAAEADPKMAAAKCLEEVKLDPESYRIGHTKARPQGSVWPPSALIRPCWYHLVDWTPLSGFVVEHDCTFLLHDRYKILCPAVVDRIVKADPDAGKTVAEGVLEEVKLDPESYRLGHTKACTHLSSSCRKQRSPFLNFIFT